MFYLITYVVPQSRSIFLRKVIFVRKKSLLQDKSCVPYSRVFEDGRINTFASPSVALTIGQC